MSCLVTAALSVPSFQKKIRKKHREKNKKDANFPSQTECWSVDSRKVLLLLAAPKQT
jgi:hypothetical protein